MSVIRSAIALISVFLYNCTENAELLRSKITAKTTFADIVEMEFEWDKNKNRQNLEKHGISFEEAQEIFYGVIFTFVDRRFEYGEIREISIGAIQGIVIVTVVHTERNNKIRLISARKATPKERRQYYEYLTKTT